MNIKLLIVTIRASLHKTISSCSVYITPNDPIDGTELDKLLKQLPKPFILMGDFNSHNIIWGCKNTDPKGRL